MNILGTEPPLSRAAFNWKQRHLEVASEAAESPLLSSAIKTNHPAADAVVIIHAHSCRKYLLLQPRMQSEDGETLEGGKWKVS